MTMEELLSLAEIAGFNHVGELNVAALRFLPEVREMCAADRCHSYGKCWTCPPYCGTLEEITRLTSNYRRGILLQSTGTLEDDFDIETMLKIERLQKERFEMLVQQVRQQYPNCLPMASGACTVCASCTCPDQPCRFPDRAIPSMEAFGLVVSEVCEYSGLPYYYGSGTITYTSCVLID